MERFYPDKLKAFEDVAPEQDTRDLTPIVSLLLYLCAEEADYERPYPLKTARPRSLGKQRVVVIPDNARTWEVGTRIGAALRKARHAAETELTKTPTDASTLDRQRPRPHWRRAHWHTFWTGPKDGERRAQVKWLPPIPVSLDGRELPVVIHPTRSKIF